MGYEFLAIKIEVQKLDRGFINTRSTRFFALYHDLWPDLLICKTVGDIIYPNVYVYWWVIGLLDLVGHRYALLNGKGPTYLPSSHFPKKYALPLIDTKECLKKPRTYARMRCYKKCK